MMFQDFFGTPSEELCIDEISSPIAAHLLDFCDDGSGGDLFAAVNATSDVFTASSEDASSSSATTPPGPCSHGDNTSSSAAAPSAFSPMPSLDSTLSALVELLLPIEYPFAAAVGGEPQIEQQFGQLAVALPAENPALQTQMSSTASELMQLAASSGYGDDCYAAAMGGAGGYVGLDEALCQPPPPGVLLSAGVADATVQGGCFFGKEAAQGGFFGAGGMVMSMMGMDEIGEYQRMMEGAAGAGALVATHSPDAESAAAAQMAFGGNAGEMQVAFSAGTHGMDRTRTHGRHQHDPFLGGALQMSGSVSPGRLPAATTETSSLEELNFKSARISVQERREKIHRYIKKRNERNFSKKIKYACRKTLADSRPRVRGRFAKNDDYGEPSTAMQNHEFEQMAGIKGEDMLDTDALQAHFSGLNSYMYNHTVESWI
ncbi:hypothetical protein EJB05_22060 [Eragrostis curvula]|uniref:CCT domain-containing protein n=1 Tax=Eragrostis curvula TaxID=38414 RepID=A0A5J9V3H1_9POAL|nr:hypothetical protein EJB05_22060 [Eragrostis curvula]